MNLPTALSGLAITDADAGDASLNVVLTASHGTLELDIVPGGVQLGEMYGNGTAQVGITSTLAQLNTTLSAI